MCIDLACPSSTIMGGIRLLFTWKFVVFPPVTVQIVNSCWSRWLDYPFWPWNKWAWKSLWWHIPYTHHPPLEDDFGWTSWHVIPIPISHWHQTWEAWENQNWSKNIDIQDINTYFSNGQVPPIQTTSKLEQAQSAAAKNVWSTCMLNIA